MARTFRSGVARDGRPSLTVVVGWPSRKRASGEPYTVALVDSIPAPQGIRLLTAAPEHRMRERRACKRIARMAGEHRRAARVIA